MVKIKITNIERSREFEITKSENLNYQLMMEIKYSLIGKNIRCSVDELQI